MCYDKLPGAQTLGGNCPAFLEHLNDELTLPGLCAPTQPLVIGEVYFEVHLSDQRKMKASPDMI